MSKFVRVEGGVAVASGTLRELFPKVRFKAAAPSAGWLEARGLLHLSGAPSFDPDTHHAVSTAPYLDGDVWRDEQVVELGVGEMQEVLISALEAKAEELIAAGFDYSIPGSDDPHNYQIDDKAQINMTAVGAKFGIGAANAHNGFWRDSVNNMVEMTDGEVKALFLAAGDYKQTIITNRWALIADIAAADTQSKIAAISIAAGTGPTATGWPSTI